MNQLASLIRLIDQGLSTQVLFKDGSMVLPFWPHDLITRGNGGAGVVVVRGLVGAGSQGPIDQVIPLCDIAGVFSQKPRQAFAPDPGFFQRNPVPRGWKTIHARAADAVATD